VAVVVGVLVVVRVLVGVVLLVATVEEFIFLLTFR